ncbi:Crp/Fnr family transcriptional regulator [Psychrilyobacter atlanticus]|uniref:Crp/Fnr family transcriptional regulator n=1 Tax=Psychrilyobacter atlanticus TaxID=271091 RepID=UPI00041F98EF|nr:Crp/Fnr family transcriptional regulator [Psychrilyobacter atlanticus]
MKIDQLAIFKGLNPETIDLLEKKLKVKKYKKGEFVFFEKDQVEKIYIIVSGKVTLHRYTQKAQKKIIYILGSGEVINEVIFDKLPASINAEVFENAMILEYSAAELKQIMSQDFELAYRIIQSTGRKVRRLYRQLKNTVPISLDKKVASKLWKLSKDYGVICEIEENHCISCKNDCWIGLEFKISITYLADMLGSTRETISRELKKLEGYGYIKWIDKRIFVKRKELRQFYRK